MLPAKTTALIIALFVLTGSSLVLLEYILSNDIMFGPFTVASQLEKHLDIMMDIMDGNNTNVEFQRVFDGIEVMGAGIGPVDGVDNLFIAVTDELKVEEYHKFLSDIKPILPEHMPYTVYQTQGIILDSSQIPVPQSTANTVPDNDGM